MVLAEYIGYLVLVKSARDLLLPELLPGFQNLNDFDELYALA